MIIIINFRFICLFLIIFRYLILEKLMNIILYLIAFIKFQKKLITT